VGGGVDNIMYAAGDLNVTVAAGRSRTVGLMLGKGYSFPQIEEELKGQTLEAVVIATRTARAVKALAKAETYLLSQELAGKAGGGKPKEVHPVKAGTPLAGHGYPAAEEIEHAHSAHGVHPVPFLEQDENADGHTNDGYGRMEKAARKTCKPQRVG
jgi:hypothetical protein